MASKEGDLRAEMTQGTLPHLGNKDAKRIGVGNSLSDLFHGQCWGQNMANGYSLRTAIKGILAAALGA
jgi:hypothetical protein